MSDVNPKGNITVDFFDFVNYNVCRAVSEHVGQGQAVKVYQRAGEIGYAELKERGLIKTAGVSPMDVLIQIVQFLEGSGYMGRIKVNRVSDMEMVVDMYQVSVLDSSIRLTDENHAPSHFMTNLMFAALKDFDMSAELDELVFEGDVDHVQERWSLKPAE